MKKLLLRMMKKMGYAAGNGKSVNIQDAYPDIKDKIFWDIYELCKPYTMTSVERLYALYVSVSYILLHDIKGAFVECGVWRGGSSMLIAKMLAGRNITDRKIYLYDTFEGMPEPSMNDINFKGGHAAEMLKADSGDRDSKMRCIANLEDVENNMGFTGFPKQQIIYVKGMVEHTIPGDIPDEPIALLRLDTDWYESTKHELIHLFPRLVMNGVLIIDDYGHWEGCKKAVDEYFSNNHIKILLSRVDYTCRIAVKTSAVSV